MRHPQVIVLGYSEASMLLRTRAAEVAAVISIRGLREPALQHSIPNCLELILDDVELPTDALNRAHLEIRWKRDAENGITHLPPRQDHAAAIIEFAKLHAELNGAMLCQCSAGISRSSAAALLCLATWTAAGDESQCVEILRQIRPAAMPNRPILALGDELLNRNGELLKAWDRVRR